jgi:hypothetical protein
MFIPHVRSHGNCAEPAAHEVPNIHEQQVRNSDVNITECACQVWHALSVADQIPSTSAWARGASMQGH